MSEREVDDEVAARLADWVIVRDRAVKLATIEACARAVDCAYAIEHIRGLDPDSITVPPEGDKP